MSLPRYVASGTFTAAAAAGITPPFPAGILPGDLALLVCESENQVITLTTPNGFGEVTNSPQGTGTAGAAGSTRLAVYAKRLVGGDSAPVVANPGDHVTGQIHVFRNVRGSSALAQDSFDRADNTDVGTNWTPVINTLQIVGNEIRCGTAGSVNCAERYSGITWPADQYSEVRITAYDATARLGPAVRLASAAFTGYMVECNSTNTQLFKKVAGAGTLLSTTAAVAVGDRVRLTVAGTTLFVTVNGVLVAQVIDTAVATGSAGIEGVEPTGGTARCDDWIGGAPNLWHVTAGGIEAASDTTGSIPGLTTTAPDCLIAALCSTSVDATGTANFSGWTNASLANLVERADNTNLVGLGGGHGLATGEKALAGVVSATTVTYAAASLKGLLAIAFEGAIPAPSAKVIQQAVMRSLMQ